MNHEHEHKGPNGALQTSPNFAELPEEVLEIIRLQQSPQFLDILATAALKPRLTLNLFTRFNPVFADSCARWIAQASTVTQSTVTIEAFARILHLAPHLSVYLENYLVPSVESTNGRISNSLHCLCREGEPLEGRTPLQLQRILLATWRLLNFDDFTYSRTISTSRVQELFKHSDRAVRYLAVRLFCQKTSASDFILEAMTREHIGEADAVMGDFDGEAVDLEFLSIMEEDRLKNAATLMQETDGDWTRFFGHLNLAPLVLRCSNVLVPRPYGPPSQPSFLIPTATTLRNIENFAKAFLSSTPILLHGLAGSGKTSLVNDFARDLGADSTLVTLHLNEQTDAKMLMGMYATGATPGSFTWRAGVLTTAVREGRWVFIEDLDRAPNEVISVILPLIERNELHISSRGETIRAGSGFKLIASIRTSLNVDGNENSPALHMLGARLWQRVAVQMPSQDEFRQIIDGTYPLLHHFLPGIVSVYQRLYALSHKPSFASRSRTSLGRPINPRHLLKWCRRLVEVLTSAGSKTGREPMSEAIQYEMFLEATDCFAGSLQTQDSRREVVSSIAEEMHIDPQRVEHFLASYIPRFEEVEAYLTIGRVRLPKRNADHIAKKARKPRPFANTTHAKRLLEQVGVGIKMAEPILLVGETGIGKTAVVQQLADTLGVKLVAVNLSQQSEVSDLLGGFKPVNVRSLAVPLKEEFDELFTSTGISTSRNERYLEQLGKCIAKSQWKRAARLWHEAPKMFDKILSELTAKETANGQSRPEQPLKRRKTESKLQALLQLKPRWKHFSQDLDQFEIQLSGGSKGFAFTFVEGNIVKAARSGDWVLLDEINLASPDTLESIADLLHSGRGAAPSILLSETGQIERIPAHPNFRIFAAMNPATDVGKRDLPMGLRSRFTELYVESPDRNLDDLLGVIRIYLKGSSSNDDRAAHDVARLYINTKRLADEKRIVDGANQVPHFSLRTLTRVLSYATEIAPSYGLRRALYEGFSMGFLTLLNRESERILVPLIDHHLLETHGNPQSFLSQTPRHPEDGKEYVRFVNKRKDRHYWMLRGSEEPQELSRYIITPFVERNMLNLVRATSTRRFPVLVQGPTSSGKTSMIEYLALFSGNKFVRINNHEHTDLQEYLGTYVSSSDGQLRFQEGLLVQALRHGHWIVLDELNLAPTDVLEALNRLLDDNRELLIPETQEIVRPHENFMLFATQNPPGLYGGRKTLSRAFRNRFLELHFDDIPEDELDYILEKRSQNVAPSDCRRIVSVYKELSRLRQSNRLFEQKDSFATLRDLFRWALRQADTREQLAANGYMLLAERVRNSEERKAVKEVIERIFKVNIDTDALYDAALCPEIRAFDDTDNAQGVVWTKAMRRLYILVVQALRNNEPVLLVGETGCGKTTVCQMLADALGKELHIVNAHQNTETGDLIGAQRPIRNRSAVLRQLRQDLLTVFHDARIEVSDIDDLDGLLSLYRSRLESSSTTIPMDVRRRIYTTQTKAKALFEWSDGSLVHAMKDGQLFLLDEISLADDSVLERLNSVLEPHRTILLAEKGVEDSFIRAAEGFQFFATMNPGGDYGKRELSPALRNRFTEIWVPALSEHDDVLHIVEAKLQAEAKQFSEAIVQFAEWFGTQYRSSAATSISVRDVLAWVKFINQRLQKDLHSALVHGAAMVYIDTLGANPAALFAITSESIDMERMQCLRHLSTLVHFDTSSVYYKRPHIVNNEIELSIGEFSISKRLDSGTDLGFALEAPTTTLNAMRLIRALDIQKPILLEGSPGVGKTTLISALACATGTPLTRINLSEQTDLMDLFGSDVPVEGADAGHFAWRDAPFLQAMQRGEWVLLDEMNLASQSVLEGLNACLDHRGEVYISELDQIFKRHPDFFVFAAQNPHHQGGGRKGLPSSFVNRFTVVYADLFGNDDLTLICRHNFPMMPQDTVTKLIHFVLSLESEVVHKRRFGSQGGPWEFNLRDILRWLQLLSSPANLFTTASPSDFVDMVFRQRFRTSRDRKEVLRIFEQIFNAAFPFRHLFHNLSNSGHQVGVACLPRNKLLQRQKFPHIDARCRLPELESIMICIQQNIPCILAGPSGSGKTTLLQHIAAICGKQLISFPLNADIDTMDLVGGFEQVDPQRAAGVFLSQLEVSLSERLLEALPSQVPQELIAVLDILSRRDRTGAEYFTILSKHLHNLHSAISFPELETFSSTCRRFVESSQTAESARFEWIDGVLIKALEQGQWLVLDNANLCSSAVLDRLNSLLEPHGFLSINEHCGPDGKPRLVMPHLDFRIFLTLDPRFGELSRAMRNRAVEVYLEPLSPEQTLGLSIANLKPETSMVRLHRFSQVLKSDGHGKQLQARHIDRVALDHLTRSDIRLLPRFAQNLVRKDLVPASLLRHVDEYCTMFQDARFENFREAVRYMIDSSGTTAGRNLGDTDFGDAQIIHPLQNSPFVPMLQRASNPYWLGLIFELNVDVIAAARLMNNQLGGIDTTRASHMNRLQRSLVRGRIKSALQDSTVHVSIFLENTLRALLGYLEDFPIPKGDWKRSRMILKSILPFWLDTFHLVSAKLFDEAAFQAHLSIGSDIVLNTLVDSAESPELSLIKVFQSNLSANFDSGFKLSTGLSMEILWKMFRPFIISKQSTFEILGALELLASRFDAIRWSVSNSVTELGQIMASLVKAYHLILTSDVDGMALVKSLKSEMDALDTSIVVNTLPTRPFFNQVFEALRQHVIVSSMGSGFKQDILFDWDMMVLSEYSTSEAMILSSDNKNSRQLQNIDVLLGQGATSCPIMDNFAMTLIRRLQNVGEVDLRSLKLLQSELLIMGKKIARSSNILIHDKIQSLNCALSRLLESVLAAHGDECVAAYKGWIESLRKTLDPRSLSPSSLRKSISDASKGSIASFPGPSHLYPVLVDSFSSASLALAACDVQSRNQLEFAALAWVQFAEGCITLYVPDKIHDPDKRQRLERDRHLDTRKQMENKLAGLKDFERLFTGQDSNLRCQMLETEIFELGTLPETLLAIYRPEKSELEQLQGEFHNLLKTASGSTIHDRIACHFTTRDESSMQELRLLQRNVVQIIKRLSERFKAYRDLTAPAISMLRCLLVGLSFALMISPAEPSETMLSLSLHRATPFLGGGAYLIGSNTVDLPDFDLDMISWRIVVEGLSRVDADVRELIMKAFHQRYLEWSKKLETNRVEAESKTGLYRFKGSAEDEDKDDKNEFDDMFPEYDHEARDVIGTASREDDTRTAAIRLARTHSDLFLGGKMSNESILLLIRRAAANIVHHADTITIVEKQAWTKSLLPGALLLIRDEIEGLSQTLSVSELYNFYTDANIQETQKLVTLICEVQSRFQELQADDEIGHMQPLEDVLVACRELLQLRHSEPLAKLITKVEKIHSYIYEWQFGGWASRANSALSQYDKLTTTIVNWRRLELSTWAKLLDMETLNCEDDAKAWWFIAYQVIVAAPLQVSHSNAELRIYAQKLLTDLESYFSTAILGQFSQRIALLRQLEKHLEILVLDHPSMSIIHSALANFISLYCRYEQPVDAVLKKGRATLEKAMRDVVLLASWKDTNIVALRDSAKRSHHKLFKIVRKFRILLGQSLDSIIKQGLPDEDVQTFEEQSRVAMFQIPTVDETAYSFCAKTIPNWVYKSKRFQNIAKTVKMMATASRMPESVIDGASYLESFLAETIDSAEELRKATPSLLNDENKDTVKHLKTRKRKLFSDTLKALRMMGIKYNLGADALAAQESQSAVLVNTSNLRIPPWIVSSGLDYYFYKCVDIAPRAREAVRQHTDDLSTVEVARSTGFLEGLLQILLVQHNHLTEATMNAEKLNNAVKMAKALWAPSEYRLERKSIINSYEKVLRWLPPILDVAVELIETHAKLGSIDNTAVIAVITSWSTGFSDICQSWDALPELPETLTTSKQRDLEQRTEDCIQGMRAELAQIMGSRPDLVFVIEQIESWTQVKHSPVNSDVPSTSLAQLDSKISQLCDGVLVAIEKHKQTKHNLPTSFDAAGWLTDLNVGQLGSIKALHCSTVQMQLEASLEMLDEIDFNDGEASKSAGAVFAVAIPILEQYLNVVRQSISSYANLHLAICKTSYVLSKTFIQIATQGFCTPSEKSAAQDGQTEKLEGGTGLGDGEGAEDISKDIQDDEDLGDLAEEPNSGEQGEIEDQEDAVDMADADMEGEMGDAEAKKDDGNGSDGDESGDEMEEESADVDDLDPTAIDEKMWDGNGEEADKEQEGDDSKGKSSKGEAAAAQEGKQKAGEGDEGEEEDEDDVGAEQAEEVGQQDIEKHDPHVQESETLDLPENMELDGNEDEGSMSGSDDKMDGISDVEETVNEEEENQQKDGEEAAVEDAAAQEDQDSGSEMDVVDVDKEEADDGEKAQEAGENAEDADEEQSPNEDQGLLQNTNDESKTDAENTVPSDIQGIGDDQANTVDDKENSTSRAQREDGARGGDSAEQREAAAEDGENGRQSNGESPQNALKETQDSSAAQPFQKLGDALERWHRQQTQAKETTEENQQRLNQANEADVQASEFQHLQDEDAEADTQALGTATKEQAHALDESMAVDLESAEMPDHFQPGETEKRDPVMDDEIDLEATKPPQEHEPHAYEDRAGAVISQAKQDRVDDPESAENQAHQVMEEDVEEVDTRLESTHLDIAGDIEIRSAADARQQWTHYESLTRDLSLSLTEQLRLILAPTLATKMRGEFRTGKRLNIKRIIPYIASQYKRDKIWMRRSVPSKRNYQIMLAVDDSKSMGESGSGSLALETLVMVSKSLSMLEVGEICVVGFGESIKVAHDFETPFSSDAGSKIFQNFGFEQSRTDVTKLVTESIELFRAARAKASGSPADLWQMELIISDGVCDSSEHDAIRRLLRGALEERIMMVFVIVDDVKNKKKGESVMDLKEAKFVKDEVTGVSNVKIERYLDTFPFQYYLIVSDLRELPGVLAALLRQWFAEVVDSSN